MLYIALLDSTIYVTIASLITFYSIVTLYSMPLCSKGDIALTSVLTIYIYTILYVIVGCSVYNITINLINVLLYLYGLGTSMNKIKHNL